METDNVHSDDETLWASMRAGDESAFESLYNRYFQVLFSYGRRLADDATADDAIQELFINLWRNRRTVGQAVSVRFYLLRSLRREIVKIRKAANGGYADLEELDEHLLPVQQSPESVYAVNEALSQQTEQLNQWLACLPPRQNEAILLRYYHNLEYADVARVLGIKEQTARNLVQKALAILKRVAILLILNLIQII